MALSMMATTLCLLILAEYFDDDECSDICDPGLR